MTQDSATSAHMVSMTTTATLPLAQIITRSLAPLNLPADVLHDRVAHLVGELSAAGYLPEKSAALPDFVAGHLMARINPIVSPKNEGAYIGRHQLVDSVEDAEIVTSDSQEAMRTDFGDLWFEDALHRPLLDIDFPAVLIPSTTPGHFHLYLDKPMPWEKYRVLLSDLGKAGILEPGYVNVSHERKYTALRLPWVKKQTGEGADYVTGAAGELPHIAAPSLTTSLAQLG